MEPSEVPGEGAWWSAERDTVGEIVSLLAADDALRLGVACRALAGVAALIPSLRLGSRAARASTPAVLARLLRRTRVREIDLTDLRLDGTFEIFRVVAERCPGLRTFRAAGCEHLDDAALRAVADRCPHLSTLDVGLCMRVTEEGVMAVARRCRELTSLSMRTSSAWGENFSDACVACVARNCAGLAELRVRACRSLTDASLCSAVRSSSAALELLEISWCRRLTDVLMVALAEHCPGLRVLEAEECVNLTDDGIGAVARGCPALQLLNVWGCWRLTVGTLTSLVGAGVRVRSARLA